MNEMFDSVEEREEKDYEVGNIFGYLLGYRNLIRYGSRFISEREVKELVEEFYWDIEAYKYFYGRVTKSYVSKLTDFYRYLLERKAWERRKRPDMAYELAVLEVHGRIEKEGENYYRLITRRERVKRLEERLERLKEGFRPTLSSELLRLEKEGVIRKKSKNYYELTPEWKIFVRKKKQFLTFLGGEFGTIWDK